VTVTTPVPSPIAFLDLARLHASIRPEIDAVLDRVITTASFVGGRTATDFETAFGAAHRTGPGAGCGSGTDALALALRAMGIRDGHEVIVPSMTFVATAEAVRHVGATPVVADVDPETLLLDEESVDRVRTPRTRAVVAVHLYGHVVPFERLRRWRESGLLVLEDAAQAHLATDNGGFVGSVGHAACFSFYPGKNLGALGDGGMVISTDDSIIAEVRALRDHGRTTKYEHDRLGWCSRLDALQSAVLDVKLTHLPEWTASRRRLAERYRDALGERLIPFGSGAVHHLLVARFADRDEVARRLGGLGIGTGIHYPIPLSRQPWMVAAGARRTPNAEWAAGHILSLPMDPLMSDQEVDLVCEQLATAAVA